MNIIARAAIALYDGSAAAPVFPAKPDRPDDEAGAYLSAVAADIVFSDGLMALRSAGFDSPAGALQEAIQSEKDSILFYTELSENAFDPAARKVFEEIIRQEKGHLRTLQLRLNDLASEG